MRILYLHQYFATPKSNAGTRSYEMAKRLVSQGHKVTFITSSACLTDIYPLSSGWNRLNIEGIELHVLHLPYSNNDSYIKRIFKFLHFSLRAIPKSFRINSDVVFATSTPLTIAIPGIIYSKVKKVPMVFEVRDLWPELPVAIGAIKNPVLIWFAKKMERLAYKSSTRLIGLSPGMCEGIEKQGILKENITLATNSCDTALFHVDENIGITYKNQILPFLGDRKLIVYTGTFGPINDVSYIVHLAKAALNKLSDVCFVAIGSGMQKKAVIDLAKAQGVLDNNLFILEPVPKTEIVKLLSAADLSLSLFGPVEEMWYNSANKLFDALASGTPIVINYGGWQKDIIEKYKCGLNLYDKSLDEAVGEIDYLLSDNERYSRAKSSCIDLAYNHYSRDIMADRLEKTLLEAVNDKEVI